MLWFSGMAAMVRMEGRLSLSDDVLIIRVFALAFVVVVLIVVAVAVVIGWLIL